MPDLLTLDTFDLTPGTCGTCDRDLFLFTSAAWDVHLAACRPARRTDKDGLRNADPTR
ncbi:MAG TPA: hypothetical protein VG795_09110 [Acidimicrobiia bacterium]|nr:hypothetical protein [Acidimicrobiia bacterium]